MDTTSNTTLGGFEKALDLVPSGLNSEVRQKIADKCDWHIRSTFHGKMKGTTRIFKLEREALEEIFADYGIDVYMGEALQNS